MRTRHWVLVLVALGIVIRIGLALCYLPSIWPDTGTYLTAADDLLNGNLLRSEGRRTPGYPLLIALAGEDFSATVVMQLISGLVTSLLLFYVALRLTGRPVFAFAAAMTYDVNLQQLFLERALLSESFSTLTVTSTVAASIALTHRMREHRPIVMMALAVGILAGVTILVRPQFIFFCMSIPLIVVAAHGKTWIRERRIWRLAALTASPMILLVFLWCAFVFKQTGYFTLSTQSGFGLVNHSVSFVELAPDRYATIKGILLKYREIKLLEQGHYGNTGWLALPEIRKATGMTLPEVSRELQRMSVQLFIDHPIRYARSVLRSWIDFWTVPLVWEPANVRPTWLAPQIEKVWWVEHKVLRLVNAAFVALILAVLLSRRMRAITDWDLDFTNISVVVILSSLVQALADYGASSRYAVTIQPLVVFLVMTTWVRSRDPKAHAIPQAAVSS